MTVLQVLIDKLVTLGVISAHDRKDIYAESVNVLNATETSNERQQDIVNQTIVYLSAMIDGDG